MGTPAIDLSPLGAVPSAPPPSPPPSGGGGAISLSSLGAVPHTAPPAQTPSAVPDITANPKGEGVYQLKRAANYQGPGADANNGRTLAVPYSQIEHATGNLGYDFANDADRARYAKDFAADPNIDGKDFGERASVAMRGEARTHGAGLLDLWRKWNSQSADPSDVLDYQKTHPKASVDQALAAVRGEDLESQIRGTPYRSGVHELETAQLKAAAQHLRENNPEVHGPAGVLGRGVENMGEFLGLDGLLKLAELPEAGVGAEEATHAQKMAAAAKTAKVLEDNPKIASLTAMGMKTLAAQAAKTAARTGAVSGAQTYIDTGGDKDAALSSAAWGAGTGALTEGLLGGVGLAREAYKAKAGAATQSLEEYQNAMKLYRQQVADRLTSADTQNADWQKVKEQQNADHADAMKAHGQALNDRATQMEQARAQWKASIDQQKSAHDAAMEAYGQAVKDRTATNQQALSGWKTQLDAQAQKHAADLADYREQLASHKQTVGSLQNEAATALKTQRQIEAQAGITNIARDATQDALGRFNAARGTANFEPVDATEAAKGVTSFGDTAEAIRGAARPVYDAINEATEGKFSELQKARATAMRASDFPEVENVEGKIDKMLESNPGVNPQEWRAAKSAWRDSKDLDRIHSAVEGAFNGISPEMAAEEGTADRAVKGENLQMRLGGLLRGAKKMDPARISELIGPDGLAGLYRAAKLTSTPELKTATQNLVEKIAQELPAPSAPVRPEPVAKPTLQPKPVAPVRPDAPAPPEALPKPNAPVKPLAPAKPEPLPRPTLPEKPANLPQKGDRAMSVLKEAGKMAAAAGVAGLAAKPLGVSPTEAELASSAARLVWHQMITNPAVGRMAEYAVDYGATPERAAKVIAAMIAKQQTEQSQQGGTQ